MRILINLLVLVIFFGLSKTAEAQVCSSTFGHAQKSQLLLNKKYISHSESREDIIYVPIKFHLVADAEGNGRLTFETLLDQLCELNTVFQDYGLKFYMKDGTVNEVDNNTIYNNPASNAGTVKMVAEKNEFGTNAINIFLTDDASTGGLGQTLGYYDFNQDWIVMRKSAAQNEARDHFVLLYPQLLVKIYKPRHKRQKIFLRY